MGCFNLKIPLPLCIQNMLEYFGIRAKKSTSILVLSKECFDVIFEWLSVEELYLFGQTCKHLQQITGEYFQRTYTDIDIKNDEFGICAMARPLTGQYIPFTSFDRFVTNISLHSNSFYDGLKSINYFELNADKFTSLTELCFDHMALSQEKINLIKPVLARIQILRVNDCRFEGDFYTNFLQFCTNLKRLHMTDVDFKTLRFKVENFVYIVSYTHEENACDWLFQKYPMLEHFELLPRNGKVCEIQTFFEQNPNVRSFSTNLKFLNANLNALMKSDTRLDCLIINKSRKTSRNLAKLYNGLNQLYKRGFFEKLQLYTENYVDSGYVDLDVTTNALEKLSISVTQFPSFYENLPFLSQLNIIELGIFDEYNFDYDMEILAKNLCKLERLHLANGTANDLLTFIRYAPKLQIIRIQSLRIEIDLQDEVLDLW